MQWYLEDMITVIMGVNGKKHRVVPIVLHEWFSFFEKVTVFKNRKSANPFCWFHSWQLPTKLVTLYPLGSILSPEKKRDDNRPFEPRFVCIVLQISPELSCNAWPTMAVLGLWWGILQLLKSALFCNNWNHSWVTKAIDLSFSPLTQKTIMIISCDYHYIAVDSLEIMSKLVGGNLILLRCLHLVNYNVH